MYQERNLICSDCGNEFPFTVGEQEFYAEKGFNNEPKRCKICRDSRKTRQTTQRKLYSVDCAACGKEAKVPFEPQEGRPVFCSECYESNRG